MSRQVRSYTLAPRTMSAVTVLVGRVEERDSRRRAESFNDWGAGYDDSVPGEVTKTPFPEIELSVQPLSRTL